MAFQQTIANNMPFGVVGELFLEGPLIAQPVRLVSGDAANNVIGRALTITAGAPGTPGDPPVAAAGGTGVFAGILANPKTYVAGGTTAGGPLAATTTLPNNTIVEAVQESPGLIVQFAEGSAPGDDVYYLTATGVLVRVASGAAAPANSAGPIGKVVRFTNTGASLAVVHLFAGANPPAA